MGVVGMDDAEMYSELLDSVGGSGHVFVMRC